MVGNFIASNDFGSRTSIISGLKSRAIFSVTKYTIKIFWKLKRSTNFIWFLFKRKEEAQPLKNICLSEWFDKERENGGIVWALNFSAVTREYLKKVTHFQEENRSMAPTKAK